MCGKVIPEEEKARWQVISNKFQMGKRGEKRDREQVCPRTRHQTEKSTHIKRWKMDFFLGEEPGGDEIATENEEYLDAVYSHIQQMPSDVDVMLQSCLQVIHAYEQNGNPAPAVKGWDSSTVCIAICYTHHMLPPTKGMYR